MTEQGETRGERCLTGSRKIDQRSRKTEFAEMLQEYAGLLSRITRSYEANPSLCDDLLQNISLALWRALPTWRGDASMKTFVARVAHNCAASHVIGQTRRPAAEPLTEDIVDQTHGPHAQAATEQRRLRLQNAVRALPLTLRQTVTLGLEGFTQREIAQVLGITANNVAVRMNRARSALKTLMVAP